MRLDKYLSHIGLGSRSQVKQIIKQKRIRVNDTIVKKSDIVVNVNVDSVYCDNNILVYEQYQYIMLNKPKGVISATEDNKHQTVLDIVPIARKNTFPVGRLDIDTEGLLLLTDNGQLAHNLLSPKKHVSKMYYVELANPLGEEHITQLENGIVIDGPYTCLPAKVLTLSQYSCHITIYEGKYHQIKRMFNVLGNKVVYLKRLSMGSLTLDPLLKVGEYRLLNQDEIRTLLC